MPGHFSHNNAYALVTGSAKRVGRALAEELSAMGYALVLHAHRSIDEVEDLAASLRAAGGVAEVVTADLCDVADTTRFAEQVMAHYPIRVVANNASVYVPETLAELSDEHFDAAMNIHCRAPLKLMQAMAAHKHEGVVINLWDAKLTHDFSQKFSYALSKHAMYNATMLAAKALAPNIRVNLLAPGATLPPVDRQGDLTAYMAARAQGLPLQRLGRLDNLRHGLRYLVENDFVTGQCLFVDGGEHL